MSDSSPRSRGFCNERNHVFTTNPCSIIHEKQDLVLLLDHSRKTRSGTLARSFMKSKIWYSCSFIHEKQDLVLTAAIPIIRSPSQVNSLIGLVIGRCHPGRMSGC